MNRGFLSDFGIYEEARTSVFLVAGLEGHWASRAR